MWVFFSSIGEALEVFGRTKKTTQPTVTELTTSRAVTPLGKLFPLGSTGELPAQHPPSLTLPGFTEGFELSPEPCLQIRWLRVQ